MKKFFSVMLLTICMASSSVTAEEPPKYSEIASGRYHMMPRSAWLKDGMLPVKYVQVHWFLEASGLSGIESLSYDDPVKAHPEWEKVRKEALTKLIAAKLLTRSASSSSHPKEFYKPLEWRRTIQQALAYRYKKTLNFCKVRLVIRSLKDRNSVEGDLRWWDERVINLSDGNCN